MKLFSRQIFENTQITSPVIPREQTDMTKLIAGFRNFANAPTKNSRFCMLAYDAMQVLLSSKTLALQYQATK